MFWHGCPEHYQAPASNVDYWRAKMLANRARDAGTTRMLTSDGWIVLRFWEHESPASVTEAILAERVKHP